MNEDIYDIGCDRYPLDVLLSQFQGFEVENTCSLGEGLPVSVPHHRHADARQADGITHPINDFTADRPVASSYSRVVTYSVF